MTVTASAMLPLAVPGSPASKRKLDSSSSDDIDCYRPPTKRISPFLNTPKQRKDERRKLFRISLNKLKDIDDSEAFLCRSVLISNFARRMQQELRDEKLMRYSNCADTPMTSQPWQQRNTRCAPTPPPLFDDFTLVEKITDDMSDSLIRTLDALGGSMTSTENDATPMAVKESQQQPLQQQQLQQQTPFVTSEKNDLCSSMGGVASELDGCEMTEKDKQILGEMDAVFNSILSLFSDSLETQTEP